MPSELNLPRTVAELDSHIGIAVSLAARYVDHVADRIEAIDAMLSYTHEDTDRPVVGRDVCAVLNITDGAASHLRELEAYLRLIWDRLIDNERKDETEAKATPIPVTGTTVTPEAEHSTAGTGRAVPTVSPRGCIVSPGMRVWANKNGDSAVDAIVLSVCEHGIFAREIETGDEYGCTWDGVYVLPQQRVHAEQDAGRESEVLA